MFLDLELLSQEITGRTENLFSAAEAAAHEVLRERVAGRRVLVIGGAGTIGAATVQALISLEPRVLHVVDQSENDLAELVRSLRNRPEGLEGSDIHALPLDFGGQCMLRFLESEPPFDIVLNFAALKHVRSEKDVPSSLQLLDTNLVKARRLLGWLGEIGGTTRYFGVSTDKAASPVNLMGASKRMMEHLIFGAQAAGLCDATVTSARFANVAFSRGSLLESFLLRIAKGHAVAVPDHTFRYFLSPSEAGSLCVLAAIYPSHQKILVPDLSASRDLVSLIDVAGIVLARAGYEPQLHRNPAEALRKAEQGRPAGGFWPVLITPRDTTGEKDREVFLGEGEVALDAGLPGLREVVYSANASDVHPCLDRIEEVLCGSRPMPSKELLISWIHDVVPEFEHREMGKNLDSSL